MRARGIVKRIAMYTGGGLEARVTELENDFRELAVEAQELREQLGAERVDRQEAFESLWRVLDLRTDHLV